MLVRESTTCLVVQIYLVGVNASRPLGLAGSPLYVESLSHGPQSCRCAVDGVKIACEAVL